MTFDQWYADTLKQYNKDSKGLRLGQFLINRLYELKGGGHLVSLCMKTYTADQYYVDGRIGDFCRFARSRWEQCIIQDKDSST